MTVILAVLLWVYLNIRFPLPFPVNTVHVGTATCPSFCTCHLALNFVTLPRVECDTRTVCPSQLSLLICYCFCVCGVLTTQRVVNIDDVGRAASGWLKSFIVSSELLC